MKTLCLDLGAKRVGVAISDSMGITAQALATLKRENDAAMVQAVKDIVREEKVSELIIGLPLNMDGSRGPQAENAASFANYLSERISVPVKLWDERMSTLEVERVMIKAGTSRQKRKKKIDQLAAQVILQSYLNSKSRERTRGEE